RVPAVRSELRDGGCDVDQGGGLRDRHVLSFLTGGLRQPDETRGLEAITRPRVIGMDSGDAEAARLAPEQVPEQLEHPLRFRLPHEVRPPTTEVLPRSQLAASHDRDAFFVSNSLNEISSPRYFVRTSSTACADFGSTKYPDVSPMRHTAFMSYRRPRPNSRPLAPTIPAPGSPRENTTPYFSISFTSSRPVAAPKTRGFVTIRPMP